METMFYDELKPDNESSMLGTPRAPILEEEEGGGTYEKKGSPAPQDPENV